MATGKQTVQTPAILLGICIGIYLGDANNGLTLHDLEFPRACGVLHRDEMVTIKVTVDLKKVEHLKTGTNAPMIMFRYENPATNRSVALCSLFVKPAGPGAPDPSDNFYGCIPTEYVRGTLFKSTLRQNARLYLAKKFIDVAWRNDYTEDIYHVVSEQKQFPVVYDYAEVIFYDGEDEHNIESSGNLVYPHKRFKDTQTAQCTKANKIVDSQTDSSGVFTPETGIGRDEMQTEKRRLKFCVYNLLRPFKIGLIDPVQEQDNKEVENTDCLEVKEATINRVHQVQMFYTESGGCKRVGYFCHTLHQLKSGVLAPATDRLTSWAASLLVTILQLRV